MSNFEFLKNINPNLFDIAQDAEMLFRDRYFEQCITQTRRFGENLCRLVIGDRADTLNSFDEMLATLKDTPSQSEIEKEFLDDMYFIKKAGNKAVHSIAKTNDGKEALECLERAFEAAINFAVYKYEASQELLNKVFDEELLITGKKSKKISLQEEYIAKKKQWIEEEKKLSQGEEKKKSNVARKKKKHSEKEDDVDLSEKKKIFSGKKSILREIGETILAGIVIYVFYLLFFR